MANQYKCECGHMNPVGTSFCENCGKVIAETPELLDMRYEGTARRSVAKNITVIDKIWMFFSSVKVAVVIILLALLASALGTVYPQVMYIPQNVLPETYYAEEYGTLGEIYYALGFHDLYGSWWYILLIALIGISLVICSLDRIIPLNRALKNQRVKKHDSFMVKQRLYTETNESVDLKEVEEALIKKRYKVKKEDGALFAEKNRFSRWGPYVNHIGLIIFLVGCMLRYLPSMFVDDYIWIREGERKVIPGTNGEYYLETHDFFVEMYKDDEKYIEKETSNIPKNYQSDVTLYKRVDNMLPGSEPELEKVKDYSVQVNKPLKFDGYAMYQTDFKLDEIHTMSFTLTNKETKESYGEFSVDLSNPKDEYKISDRYTVEIERFLPDFYFNSKGEPDTKTRVVNNPAFVFNMIDNEEGREETVFIAIQQNIEASENNELAINFANVTFRDATALTIKRDRTIPILSVGGTIFLIGVIQGMYWNHRRIWVRKTKDGYKVAAHSNKNYYGFKREIEEVCKETNMVIPSDQVDKKGDSIDARA